MADDRDEDRLHEVIEWAIDHCAAEVNFEASALVAGDPQVLWNSTLPVEEALRSEPWQLLELAGGQAVAVRGEPNGDGPWVFVTTTSDGPLDRVSIQPTIWTDGATTAAAGSLTLPTGRLVIGSPEAVEAWGPAVEPEGGAAVQTKAGWDDPVPTYVGLITVIDTGSPGICCEIEIASTAERAFHAVSVLFPRPVWVPGTVRP